MYEYGFRLDPWLQISSILESSLGAELAVWTGQDRIIPFFCFYLCPPGLFFLNICNVFELGLTLEC